MLEKGQNLNFHNNPFSGRRVVPYGQADGRIGMTPIIAAFRNFAKAPKNFLHDKNVTVLALQKQIG